jgi:hypothetical protein
MQHVEISSDYHNVMDLPGMQKQSNRDLFGSPYMAIEDAMCSPCAVPDLLLTSRVKPLWDGCTTINSWKN